MRVAGHVFRLSQDGECEVRSCALHWRPDPCLPKEELRHLNHVCQVLLQLQYSEGHMSEVIAMSRSPAGNVPKPTLGHSASINKWSSYIPKSVSRQRETSMPCPMCFNMISSSTNLSSHVRIHTSGVLSRQVMIKRHGPALCVVYGSQ